MKFVLISFLIGFIIKINLINALHIFGEIYTEKKIANNHLAKKYCDSLEKNLFKGLDKESILKYEYFFSSIPNNFVLLSLTALIPFKSTEKQGKANSKSILSLALFMFSLVAWMCLFR